MVEAEEDRATPPAAVGGDVCVRLTIPFDPEHWSELGTLLQRGVRCFARTGCSVGDFLTEQLELDAGYVKNRIATVFLDGRVVDDLQAATLHAGSTLALSAAMPGLVGATLRKGGFYANMRSEISWKPDDGTVRGAITTGPPCTVSVKLFNLILHEVGPSLLARGIILDRQEAIDALGWWCSGLHDLADGRSLFLQIAPT